MLTALISTTDTCQCLVKAASYTNAHLQGLTK